MAKKKQETSVNEIDLSNDDVLIKFNIRDDEGKQVGTIEDTVCKLHRLVMLSQYEAKQDDYVPHFVRKLNENYRVKVSESAAYRMVAYIMAQFVDVKKN
jgi:hypothetical protein